MASSTPVRVRQRRIIVLREGVTLESQDPWPQDEVWYDHPDGMRLIGHINDAGQMVPHILDDSGQG